MSVIKKPPARAAYATLPRYGRTNTTTRWFTRASGRRALGAMFVARLPHRRTSGRLLSWHGWMEAAILLLPMPRAEAELTRRVTGIGLNALITEKAGRCLGVSELTASLTVRARRATTASPQFYFERRGLKRTELRQTVRYCAAPQFYLTRSVSPTTTLLAGSSWPTLTLYFGLLFKCAAGISASSNADASSSFFWKVVVLQDGLLLLSLFTFLLVVFTKSPTRNMWPTG